MPSRSSPNKPTNPTKVPAQKPKTQRQPLPKFSKSELAKPTSLETTNKYEQKPMIGEVTIDLPGEKVTKVGLGGLQTVTNYGDKPDV